MKTFSLIIFLLISAAAFSQHPGKEKLPFIPPPKGRVNDFVHFFTIDEGKSLDSLIAEIQKSTTIQVALATIDSTMLGNLSIDQYALNMLRKWGVGVKEKNNGILVLIVPDTRYIRIENGYGIEKYLSNQETKEIIDTVFIPYFKEGNYFLGTKNGILSLIKHVNAYYTTALYIYELIVPLPYINRF